MKIEIYGRKFRYGKVWWEGKTVANKLCRFTLKNPACWIKTLEDNLFNTIDIPLEEIDRLKAGEI